MNQMLSLINLMSSCVLAALAAWAVMSPTVKDGVVVKVGLIFLSFGHAIAATHLFGGIEAADLMGLNRARFVSNTGLVVIVLGYWWRHRCGEGLCDVLPTLRRP